MAKERWELRVEDERYPELLRDIADIAPVIRGIGDPEVLNLPCFSIVGARRATPYGLAIARMAAKAAVECGVCVVSGGAMGCDRAAGEAALEAGGKTVIVAGCGADIVYPRSSARLFEETVEKGGAIVSIEPWGSTPRRYAFPKRNNVIAALSQSMLVTEAGIPSGTFSTATAAGNLGRHVYAAPGSIFSPNSAGSNQLIEMGALIIVDELSLKMRISMDYGVLRLDAQNPVSDPRPMIRALKASPMRLEALAASMGQDTLTALRNLANYEALGLVKQLPDGRYAPTESAFLYQD